MFDHIMPLSQAKEGYQLFHDMKLQKGEISMPDLDARDWLKLEAVIFDTRG